LRCDEGGMVRVSATKAAGRWRVCACADVGMTVMSALVACWHMTRLMSC